MAVDPGAGLVQPPPVLTRIAGTGSSSLVYTLALGEELLVEAIAVDVDAGAAPDSTIAVSYVAQSGETFAISSTIAKFPGGVSGVVTFAPNLPDSAALGLFGTEAILQTGLAACQLVGGTTLRIDATSAAVKLTEGRIWASNPGGQQVAEQLVQLPIYLMPNDPPVGTLA